MKLGRKVRHGGLATVGTFVALQASAAPVGKDWVDQQIGLEKAAESKPVGKTPPVRNSELVAVAPTATPSPGKTVSKRSESKKPAPHPCIDKLSQAGVIFERVNKKGIAVGVQIKSPLGGVEYLSYDNSPLVIDCSLAYSLAQSGEFLLAHQIKKVRYSSAFSKRNIRGTKRPSKHSYGLAIDIHTFLPQTTEPLTVQDDYEQGLGDDQTCMGQPITEAGAALRALFCHFEFSGLFRLILTPDYDADHYNHFHVEAKPWPERAPDSPETIARGWSAVEPARPALQATQRR